MKLPREWKELIDCLCSNHVRFLVVGAHALAVHGRPRATGDLDIFVEPTQLNAERVAVALGEFGFSALAEQASEFARPDRMATLGREPLRIDIMTSISGVSFAAAWKGRVRTRVDGQVVNFLGLREFLRNKKASGRAKDLLDVALVEEGRGSAGPSEKKRDLGKKNDPVMSRTGGRVRPGGKAARGGPRKTGPRQRKRP